MALCESARLSGYTLPAQVDRGAVKAFVHATFGERDGLEGPTWEERPDGSVSIE